MIMTVTQAAALRVRLEQRENPRVCEHFFDWQL